MPRGHVRPRRGCRSAPTHRRRRVELLRVAGRGLVRHPRRRGRHAPGGCRRPAHPAGVRYGYDDGAPLSLPVAQRPRPPVLWHGRRARRSRFLDQPGTRWSPHQDGVHRRRAVSGARPTQAPAGCRVACRARRRSCGFRWSASAIGERLTDPVRRSRCGDVERTDVDELRRDLAGRRAGASEPAGRADSAEGPETRLCRGKPPSSIGFRPGFPRLRIHNVA